MKQRSRKPPTSMLAAALHLAVELSQPVFPCHFRTKLPLTQHGHRAASTDESLIRTWWTRNPQANIGLRTGMGLIVVDVDGKRGAKALKALEKANGVLPATVTAISRRGPHLYFEIPEVDGKCGRVPCSVSLVGDKLDIRADGGYVLVPRSIVRRPGQKRFQYRWRRGHAPGEHELAVMPAWLLAAALQPKDGSRRGPGKGPGTAVQSGGTRARDKSNSGRDFQLALTMLRDGASDRDIGNAIRRVTTRKESYIDYTIANAHRVHEANAPVMRPTEMRLDHLPGRFGRPARTQVILDLVEVARGATLCTAVPGQPVAAPDKAKLRHEAPAPRTISIVAAIIVPSSPRYDTPKIVTTWAACFPDLSAESLTAKSAVATRRAWESIVWRGRTFRVASENGEVKWIRSATPLSETARRAQPRARGSR